MEIIRLNSNQIVQKFQNYPLKIRHHRSDQKINKIKYPQRTQSYPTKILQ